MLASGLYARNCSSNKALTLAGHFVSQGNGNGQSIPLETKEILYTSDLVDCIAVLLVGEGHCYMIHSDTNDNKRSRFYLFGSRD